MSGRRGMTLALLLAATGAVLVLATASQPRWTVEGASTSGGDAPAATALALVVLAGLGLLLLLRGRSRSLVGLLVVVVGIGVLLVNLGVAKSATGWVGFGPLAPGGSVPIRRSPWFWLTTVGAALIVAGGVVIALYGRRWPSPRRDYRPAPAAAPRRDAWTALDHGEDPTL